ncbi:MAG: basic amino acid ABC transporter substrate-binding protein [Oscillospiraceae bacterium]|nr:basic amino acid ABC transporter substrate-binding protein [Oscillospiraceae bacterium]
MTKKILALALAAVMAFALVACNAPAEETLTMGTNAAFPPYEFMDDAGNVVGIDAEIAAAVAEKLGMKLEIKDMAFDSLITAVSTGSVDIVLAGMTVTEERLESVNFSDSYATGIQVVIVKEDSAIASIDDLEGKKIGVQTGTTGDIYCSDAPENGGYGEDAVARYDNGALAVAALQNGQVDCVVIDNEPAKAFVEANEGLKILETEFAVEDYAAAIAKENTELLDKVNAALAELKAEGKLDEIIGKYIKAE